MCFKLEEYNPENEGFKEIAIAIKLFSYKAQQRHVGIFMKKRGDSKASLLHLGWHNSLSLDDNENIGEGYHYLNVLEDLSDSLKEMLVDHLHAAWTVNGSDIPYSLLYDSSVKYFEDSGEWKDSEPGHGLTCATFVIECFKSYGFEFIDYGSWPVRAEDQPWKDRILWVLENNTEDINPEHVSKQRALANNIVRFRPEEVAAAANKCKSGSESFNFDEIQPIGNNIAEILNCYHLKKSSN